MKKRFFAVAEGRVQGVGFRFFVRENALNLFVTGWVKNMPDGTVAMELQGNDGNLECLIKRLKMGDRFIEVNKITVQEQQLVEMEKNFVIAN